MRLRFLFAFMAPHELQISWRCGGPADVASVTGDACDRVGMTSGNRNRSEGFNITFSKETCTARGLQEDEPKLCRNLWQSRRERDQISNASSMFFVSFVLFASLPLS